MHCILESPILLRFLYTSYKDSFSIDFTKKSIYICKYKKQDYNLKLNITYDIIIVSVNYE